MPRYVKNGIVRSLYAVNVPFMVPLLLVDIPPDEHYELIPGDDAGDPVVLFKPHEWRGTGCAPAWDCLTSEKLAAEVGGWKAGSVASIYLTSDGGASIDDL